jgi:hypothetical protein
MVLYALRYCHGKWIEEEISEEEVIEEDPEEFDQERLITELQATILMKKHLYKTLQGTAKRRNPLKKWTKPRALNVCQLAWV